MAGTSPAMTETGVEALFDHDLAGHAELGVGLAILMSQRRSLARPPNANANYLQIDISLTVYVESPSRVSGR